jgi:hypothetical protein
MCFIPQVFQADNHSSVWPLVYFSLMKVSYAYSLLEAYGCDENAEDVCVLFQKSTVQLFVPPNMVHLAPIMLNT